MNTTTTTHWAALSAALNDRQPIWVTYHGQRRLLCPHALGWHNRAPLVLAYQTGGHTSTGTLDPDPQRRWRCLRVDHIDATATADPDSPWGSATNYNPDAPFPNPATTTSTALSPTG